MTIASQKISIKCVKSTQHILIKGRVQGVGFRHYILVLAENLGVIGWARNLKDGRVEAIIQGPKHVLEEFLQEIKLGTKKSNIESMDINEIQNEPAMKGFYIKADGDKVWQSS